MRSPPIAATMTDSAAFADELCRFRILPADRFRDLLAEFPSGSATGLAEYLVSRGELTAFQAERTLSGAAKSLAIGPYRLLEPHQIGAFGPIFRADKAGKQFAIRVLPLRSLWQSKQAKQLVRTLSTIPAHPSVIPMVDADSSNGYHYLVWPLAGGELLEDRVRSGGPLPAAEATLLLAHLSAGLAACHERNVFHGLLTPQAIALRSDRVPQMLEIGAGMLLSANLVAEESLFDTMSTTVAMAGALEYAAPEWLADPAKPTPAGDQYSLGAIGCFVLTGSPPPAVPGTSLPADVPAELRTVLERLLESDPALRFSGMDEVREILAELAGFSERSSAASPFPETLAQHGNRGELPGNSTAWQAPVVSRPVERDDSDASIGFELPDDLPEESASFQVNQSSQHSETASHLDQPMDTPRPTPTRWSNQTQRTPSKAPESRLLGKFKGINKVDLPPVLPAAPLVPEPSEGKVSGSWNAVPAKTEPPPPAPSGDRPSGSILWKKMKRKVLFWQPQGDTIQVSVFGPTEVVHSQAPKLTVFLHSPMAAESVGTLARAFHHDAVLLGTGRLSLEVIRGTRLDVHVAVEHIAVSNPLAGFKWQGQPHRKSYDLVVPWEAPLGNAVGVVSIGREDVRIGKVEFVVPIRAGRVQG